MKKRLVLLSALLILSLLPGCGKSDDKDTAKEPTADAAIKEEKAPPAPGEENWGTAPEFKSTLITTTPIRYLCATVGSTEEEVNLTWYSPSEASGQVYWTTADDTEFTNATVYSTSAVPSEITDGYFVNKVTVTGLTPETEYLYQVGNEEAMSPAYTYTTPAFSDTFRFTAVGDAQIGKPVEEVDRQKGTWHKVLNKMKHHFPDSSFLVSLGDQVNDFDDNEQYNAFLNHGALYSTSLAPVKGNHDMGGPQFTEHYSLPNQSEFGTCDGNDGDYWFTRGNALFLVLNTMDPAKWGEHQDFIAEAVEANPHSKWRIVFSHFSPYNAYEDYLANSENIRPYFLEFTDAYDIDLVICGHDHLYTRTHFIQADGSFTEYESPAANPEGTLYLTLNSSSGSLYKRPAPMHEAAVSEKRENPEITDVQITPDSLTVTTYAAETWEILDTFEIQKQ